MNRSKLATPSVSSMFHVEHLDRALIQSHGRLVSEDPAPAPSESPFALVTRWKSEGVPQDQWRARLLEGGLDPESAQVVINSIAGRTPADLPAATFGQGTNPLAPGSFAFTDLGLQGHPATVGLYWLVFGVAVLVMLSVFALLVFSDVVREPDLALVVVARVMGTIGVLALLRGAWQVFGSISVKRR